MLSSIMEFAPMLIKGTGETLYMTIVSTIFAYVIGLPLGILVYISKDGGIHPNKFISKTIGGLINIVRSIPFIILIIALFPFTTMLIHTSIGPTSAIVSLVVASAPFVARMVETALEELDTGVIEAAKTMGATDMQIITKVLIPESIPSLIRGGSITTITLLGYSAMAGAVGAGGLGDIAIRFGMYRYEYTVMWITIILIVVIVQIMQMIFNYTAKKIDKKNK